MSDGRLISIGSHPRAAPAVRRAKAYGGLGGFGLAALAGLYHGAPLDATLGRALVAGIASYLLVWAAALVVVKRLLVAEATVVARRARADAAPVE